MVRLGHHEHLRVTQDSANQTTSGRDVFVSYASQDVAVANSIVEHLEAQGVKCWIAPRDVKPGAQYADAIVRAINDAKAVVLVMSASAVESSHVAREVERAASKRKPIIPFRIDTAPLNPELEYFLSNAQWIDAKGLGIPAALAKLRDAVGQGSVSVSQGVPRNRVGGVGKRVGVAAAVLIAVGVAVMVGLQYWSSSHKADHSAEVAMVDKSIAVLPFVDMSEKKDQEYFSDGLSEELIDMLTKVPELRVPARTSSFYFKGKQATVADIAKALNVGNVLEGSIRKSGDRIRITVQLIRVDTGYHLWSETYDRKLDDIFKVQDDIAAAVVSALKVSLLPESLPKATGTASPEAYTLYLQASEMLRHASESNLKRARDYLEQSIALDATFAPAWARLTTVFTSLNEGGFVPLPEARDGARHAAERAIALGPNLAAARLAMARVKFFFDWDWAAADEEIQRARKLDPNDIDALRWAGGLARTRGRIDSSIDLLQQATDRDPLMAANYMQLGLTYQCGGKIADAEASWRKAVALGPPDGFGALESLQTLQLLAGHAAEFLAQCPLGPNSDHLTCLALAYFALGRRSEADDALADLETHYAVNNEQSIAEIYAYRAQPDQAFLWLNRAYEARNTFLPDIACDPFFKNQMSDSRFKAFMRKMRLPE